MWLQGEQWSKHGLCGRWIINKWKEAMGNMVHAVWKVDSSLTEIMAAHDYFYVVLLLLLLVLIFMKYEIWQMFSLCFIVCQVCTSYPQVRVSHHLWLFMSPVKKMMTIRITCSMSTEDYDYSSLRSRGLWIFFPDCRNWPLIIRFKPLFFNHGLKKGEILNQIQGAEMKSIHETEINWIFLRNLILYRCLAVKTNHWI